MRILKKVGHAAHQPFSSSLTEVAGEGGPHLAPQKFLLSQQFRHLMRCKKYVNKIYHSSVLELRKNQFLKKINVLKTFLEIKTTHYLEGLDLKLNNETYAKGPNL